MSEPRSLSETVRDRIRARSAYRCGYCLAPESLMYATLRVDHIIPKAAGGTDDETNLWASCDPCNAHKADKSTGVDLETGETVPLFNPAVQVWTDHFAFGDDRATILGRTPIGRATVLALKMNNADVLALRRRWVSVGWYPPPGYRQA